MPHGRMPLFWELPNLAADAGASRVRIADTIGLSTPLEIHRLIMDLKKIRPCGHGIGVSRAQ